jgi:rhamnosyltransferase
MNEHLTSNQSINNPTEENTVCILVAYKPDRLFPDRIRRIFEQTRQIVIVNNGPKESLNTYLADINHPKTQIHLIQNNKNMGLGHALNQGIEHCHDRGYEWALLLDQDTQVDSDIIVSLSRIIETISPHPAIVGANYRDTQNGNVFIKCNEPETAAIKRKTVITSGSLLNLKDHLVIGPFRSDYFIDSIDHEYCLRARSIGLSVLMSCKPLMSHNIGTTFSEANIFERYLRAPNHPPVRKYYIARNIVLTIIRYWSREPAWCLKQIFRLISEIIFIILFEDPKKEKLAATMNGIADGIHNKSGQGPLEH